MLKLPLFQPAEIEAPQQMFRCEFYKATIAAGTCIARQKGTVSFARGGQVGRVVRARYEYCGSGKCEQGNLIAARLEDYEPEATEKELKHQELAAAGPARVVEIEKKLEQQAEAPTPPAEEGKPMPKGFKADPCETCGGPVGNRMPGRQCRKCRDKTPVAEERHKPAAPRTVADVVKKHARRKPRKVVPLPSAPSLVGNDVVQMLQQKRQEHLDQVDRIDKAIEALSA